MRTRLLLSLLLLASVVGAEEVTWTTGGEAGLTQGAVNPVLYEDGAPIAIPGSVSLVAQAGDRDYTWTGLPDAVAGSGTLYTLAWDTPGGLIYAYAWPRSTITPQSIVWAQAFAVSVQPLVLGVGDTLPVVQLTVSGLAADPTGATVTFSMGSPGVANKISGAAATLSDIDFDATSSTWSATAEYAWSGTNTDTAGSYRGWFSVTFSGGGVMTWPPDRSLGLQIVSP